MGAEGTTEAGEGTKEAGRVVAGIQRSGSTGSCAVQQLARPVAHTAPRSDGSLADGRASMQRHA